MMLREPKPVLFQIVTGALLVVLLVLVIASLIGQRRARRVRRHSGARLLGANSESMSLRN